MCKAHFKVLSISTAISQQNDLKNELETMSLLNLVGSNISYNHIWTIKDQPTSYNYALYID